MTITKFLLLLILLDLSTCKGCECTGCGEPEWATKLPPETQTGENTYGCYVNGDPFVARYGFSGVDGTPIYADYNGQMLNIITSDYKSRDIILYILYPKENATLSSFNVFANDFNGKKYAGINWWFNDGIIVEGNQDIGEINITKFDTINKIVSGNFHCKMGKSQNFNILDMNTYKLDSIANISQGRFDLIMNINHY